MRHKEDTILGDAVAISTIVYDSVFVLQDNLFEKRTRAFDRETNELIGAVSTVLGLLTYSQGKIYLVSFFVNNSG